MIKYQVEKFHEIQDEITIFWREHWEETYTDKEVSVFNPDYEKYASLSRINLLHLVTVRENDKIIGYYLSILSPSLHSKNVLTCYSDMFYIIKEKRKGFVGINLFKFLEQSLKEIGVRKIYTGIKTHIDIGPILSRLGYKFIEKLYIKAI